MIIVTLLAWIVFGLVVGLVARLVVPGRQSMGLAATTLLGVAGSVVGGLLAAAITGQALGSAHPAGFVGSLVGAVVCLVAVVALQRPVHV
jgi:uncharacterized membrane protein YeaQ/YmgE (transglycosylase-associated protein family)